MKFDITNLDLSSFKVKEGIINGKKVFLINPVDFDCKWTRTNLNLRSLMIDADGNIISHGLKKFFNYTEKPDLYPNPENFKDGVFMEKTDGSCGIFDWIFDGLNVRTRGTVSYKTLENAADFDFLINKYPKIKDVCRANSDYTYLFEVTSPNQKIVLDYGNEPELYYLGCIHKPTGFYTPFYLDKDNTAKIIGCKTPEIYKLDGSLSEIYNQIKIWENKEGCVLSYNGGSNMVKLKCAQYLMLHRFKSNATLNNTIDLFFEYNCPNFEGFKDKLIKTFDEDCYSLIENYAKLVCDSYIKVLNKINELKDIININSNLNQKSYAEFVLTNHKEYSNFLFTLRKSELNNKQIRMLLEKELVDI